MTDQAKLYTMLEVLISSKTRIKLLLKFFLNPGSKAYLRGLAEEFNESTNSVRIELNRFEEAGCYLQIMLGIKKYLKPTTNIHYLERYERFFKIYRTSRSH